MLSLIANLKHYIPFILVLFALSYGTYWHFRYDAARAEILQLRQTLSIVSSQLEAQNKAVLKLKDESKRLSQAYKLKDLENARRAGESEKRVTTILQMSLPSDCNEAIQAGIKTIN